ncbi:UNVERIFIED_CONTAM: hypothetical protein PYX00_008925 [Menopon gallinae]|uniref:Uncharacterized protein n=1 Tax=Menopon gallinae TaxID=328185 RepID=A0AAW2H9E2_9NEOP
MQNRDFDGAEDFEREETGSDTSKENYFQEIYMLQSAPKQIEFGHVYENPNEWEQRYEKKDFDRNRHQGKVRWADKKGGHGEHYWDYNHSGRAGDGEEYEGSAAEQVGEEDGPGRQHRKRQSPPEEKRPRSKEVEDFLHSFHRDVMGVVNLERLNENLFSPKASTEIPELANLDGSFRFLFDFPKRQIGA